jgi:RecB family exonuclease
MVEIRYSATETFQVCRRKYQYEYAERLTRIRNGPEPVTHATIGNAFHAAMEAYYSGKDGRRALEDYISEHGLAGQTIKVGKSEVDTALCARGLYNRYIGWAKYSKFDEGRKIFALEQRLSWEIIPGVAITGKPDRIDIDQYGNLHIIDFKTVGQYTKFDNFSDKNPQMLTYSVLAEQMYAKQVSSVTLLQVHRQPPKTNPVAVDPLTEFYTNDQIAEQIEILKSLAYEIKALHAGKLDVYPHRGDHCGWCPFRDLCQSASAEPEFYDTIRERFRVKAVDEE